MYKNLISGHSGTFPHLICGLDHSGSRPFNYTVASFMSAVIIISIYITMKTSGYFHPTGDTGGLVLIGIEIVVIIYN